MKKIGISPDTTGAAKILSKNSDSSAVKRNSFSDRIRQRASDVHLFYLSAMKRNSRAQSCCPMFNLEHTRPTRGARCELKCPDLSKVFRISFIAIAGNAAVTAAIKPLPCAVLALCVDVLHVKQQIECYVSAAIKPSPCAVLALCVFVLYALGRHLSRSSVHARIRQRPYTHSRVCACVHVRVRARNSPIRSWSNQDAFRRWLR